MNDKDIKLKIQSSIKAFSEGNVSDKSLAFFSTLGYIIDRQNPFPEKTYNFFKESFLDSNTRFNEDKAIVKEWKSIDLLFQLSQEEVSSQQSLFDTKQVDNTIIETYLFFVIELANNDYSRTALAQITREINKAFPMPAMLVFKHGNKITVSVINRRLHKRDSQKDVLEKVTLIKDISCENPHRAHIEILFDLSFPELLKIHKFTNFVELHNAWQKTLDTKELNKRFYRELSDWYFWAMHEVYFPGASIESDKKAIFQKEEKVREHNAKNLIRLLTRILFVWFIKEKSLIPEELFDEIYIKEKLISGFEPRKKINFDHKALGSKYYRAILQNLFFATLNQTVGKREFRKDGQQMNVTNLMRYEKYFKDSKAFLKMVEEVVPFMNGGLFECLDSPDPILKGKKGGDVINYEDGFSDRKDNPLCVPDYIFFGTGEHADLSEEYGDKKQKDVTVSGLINILKSYKFTVTENTPIEEDIALDPELLGRVFENLLASYNPETKTTARKQTGSFYTPREIVNYMVDESIKAYLKQKLESETSMKPEDAETGLDYLIGYNEKGYEYFDEKQISILINAIDNCKILDPACGSGAFPMGILHKLVHVLHKLDPNNEKWRNIQRQKAIKETEEAFNIGNKQEREDRLKEISDVFEYNSDDYGRKLYLIENCIYGVDIQPIATQISKLRFFISLIVDQRSNKARDNFGIRPLPNLETKFVAANTLIGIEKHKSQGSLFDNKAVNELEDKLKDVRHKIFNAKTPATKRKLREEDYKLREKMGMILEDSGWDNETARLLSAWNPYDQNTSCSFFDPEWMFGITDGFDVVIGNPPYISYYSKNLSIAYESREFVSQLKAQSKFIQNKKAKGRLNSMNFFIEKGIDFLNKGGNLCHILDISINEKAALDIRKYICTKTKINELIYNLSVFENVTSDQMILSLIKNQPSSSHMIKWKEIFDSLTINIAQSSINYENGYSFYYSKHDSILNLIDKYSKPLSDSVDHTIGVQIGGKSFIYKGKTIDSLFLSKKHVSNSYKNIVSFEKYKPTHIDGYIIFDIELGKAVNKAVRDANIALPNNIPFLNSRKIILRQSSAIFTGTIAEKGFSCEHKFFLFKLKDDSELSLEFLLGIINSKLMTFYGLEKNIIKHGEKKQPQIRIKEFIKIPIINKFNPVLDSAVKYLMTLNKTNINKDMAYFFERFIDAIVYELYLHEAIKTAGFDVLKHLSNFPELKDDWSDDKKQIIIEKVYKELSDPKHPVSIAMFKLDTIEEVRIIEGKQ